MTILFLDRAWWLYVQPGITLERLIEIEQAIGPVIQARTLSLLKHRLDEDAA